MGIKFLKKASSLAPTKSLRFMLHKHLSGFEPARPLFKVHASALTKEEGFCPRYVALHDVLKAKPKDEWLTTSENVTFHLGRVLQDAVVNWFADMGKAVGHWKCMSCGTMHEFQLRPVKCSACGFRQFKPEEVRFESAISGASCGVDMLLITGEPKLRPVEIKTMDKDKFKDLAAPLSEHKWRTNFYLRLIAESQHPWSDKVATDEAKILYISKGGYGALDPKMKEWGLTDKYSPFKEWEIKRNDAETETLDQRARVVKDFRAGKVGMPCGICTTALAKRATYCSMKGPCWSGDHPAQYRWTKP